MSTDSTHSMHPTIYPEKGVITWTRKGQVIRTTTPPFPITSMLWFVQYL